MSLPRDSNQIDWLMHAPGVVIKPSFSAYHQGRIGVKRDRVWIWSYGMECETYGSFEDDMGEVVGFIKI